MFLFVRLFFFFFFFFLFGTFFCVNVGELELGFDAISVRDFRENEEKDRPVGGITFPTVAMTSTVLNERNQVVEPSTNYSVINIGAIMIDLTTFRAAFISAFLIALEDLNQDPNLLPQTTLNGIWALDEHSPSIALNRYFEMEENDSPTALITSSSRVSRSIAVATPIFKTPQLSYASTLPDLSDTITYPYFCRLVPSDSFQGKVLAHLVKQFGWDRVAAIHNNDAYGTSIVEEFTKTTAQLNILMLTSNFFTYSFSLDGDNEEYWDSLRAVISKTKKSGARVILLAMSNADAKNLIKTAIEEDFVGPPITYLVTDGIAINNLFETEDPEFEAMLRQATVGMLGTTLQNPFGPLYDAFVEDWLTRDPMVYPLAGTADSLNSYTALSYDTTYTIGLALDRLIRRGEDVKDGDLLLKSILEETDFVGLTGPISFDENGDRQAIYDIVNVRDPDLGWEVVGVAKGESGITIFEEITFSDGSNDIPSSAELIYVDWDDAEAVAMISLISLELFFVILSAIFVQIYRQTPIFHYSSPRFTWGVLFGVSIILCSVFVWTGYPSSASCQARPWIVMTGFVVIFGSLGVKAIRFLWIMKKRKTRLRFHPTPDFQLFFFVLLYFLLFAIPLIVWTVSFPLHPDFSDSESHNSQVNVICSGEQDAVFLSILLSFALVSILIGIIVAIMNNSYVDFFSEATYIGYTLFTVSLTCCVVVPLLFLLWNNPEAFYVVLNLGIIFGAGSVMYFMVVPKMIIAIFKPEENKIPTSEDGNVVVKKKDSVSSSTTTSSQHLRSFHPSDETRQQRHPGDSTVLQPSSATPAKKKPILELSTLESFPFPGYGEGSGTSIQLV